MSESSTEPATTGTDGAGGEQQQQQSDAPKPTETVEFWKGKAREQERRAKANADAAQRLREIEDSSKSEVQRALERAEAAEKAAAESSSRALRYEVAAAKGLTARQALRLIGSTREELESDADALLADLAPPNQRVTVPSFDTGARANNGRGAPDMNAAIRRAAGR